ncbi:TetR/AcrR family transcriptional regulator [Roseomonas populi]|uniref:TetR/AcrR family transcriptional regulator n=1 Tax=Roseomonas populi TaxID=3121582 RepID=A0ABT1X9A6_9PROT|nr:TetR/AcrR family transcriptional regulator [Roseomonas pecuniae]MCR0984696.1 TetR/AcrR family transcriptional regulator [Roseomonas pecuniae]
MRQKQRTRRVLLASARALVAEGRAPSVAEVADHAGISRSSAYRYFSTPEAMVQEAVLDALASAMDGVPATAPEGDPAQAAEGMVAAILAMVLRNEVLFRAFLAESVKGQEDAAPRRGGRRVVWLSEALAPLRGRVPAEVFERLVAGLSLFAGIETVVVLRDVCGQDEAAMEATARWAARALVEAALRG